MDESTVSLSTRHRATLELIFRVPTSSGLKWKSVEALVIALGGEIKQGSGSRVRLLLNGSIARFHRPHPSPDTDKGAVASLREWLESTGVKP